jgi:hypothetical protein
VGGEYLGDIVTSEVLNDERVVSFNGLGRDDMKISESCIVKEKAKVGVVVAEDTNSGVLDFFDSLEYVTWHEVNMVAPVNFSSRKSVDELISFMEACAITLKL